MCTRTKQDGHDTGDRRAIYRGEITRHQRAARSGATEHAAVHRAAADPRKERRLSKPSDRKVGQQGARLHMLGDEVGGAQHRRASVRRCTMALVLAVAMGYITLGDLGAASAVSVDVRANGSLELHGEGALESVGHDTGDRRAIYRGEITRHQRAARSGATEHAAVHRAAADQ